MPQQLIDVSKFRFLVEPRYFFYGWTQNPKIFGRLTTLKALVRAKKLLPEGYNFKIWDMARPRDVQLKMIASFRRRLKITHPKLSSGELTNLVYHYAAKPKLKVERIDTHRNGGALDLTIVDTKGNELYMGTDHDDLTEKAATSYFESKSKLSELDKAAAKNRKLLIRVMKKAGFENYGPEWWHWSCPK